MSRESFFGLVFGVFFAALLGAVFGAEFFVLLVLSLGSVSALFFLKAADKSSGKNRSVVGFFLLGFGAMALYFALYTGVLTLLSEKYDGFTGQVVLEAADFPDGNGAVRARIVSEKGASPYLVRLSNYAETDVEITPGSRFHARVSLRVPENTPRFSSLRYYRASGICLTGYISEISGFTRGEPGLGNWHKYLRNGALERIDLLYGDEAYLMKGLLFGEKSGFPDGFASDASAAGVSHVFAVSGMHLSFLVSAVLLLSRRRWSRYAAIAVVLVFMAVTGFEPSVVRSGIMQIAALWAHVRGRESESFGSMAFSLLVLLAINPCSIGDIGLQFSFCAVAGILLVGEKLKTALYGAADKLPKKLSAPLRRIVPAVSVSLSATLFTIPPSVLYFERLSLVSVVSNIAMNWLVSVVFVAGMVSLILSCIWIPLGEALAWVNSWGASALEFSIGMFANVPFAVLGAESVWIKLALAAAYGAGGFFFGKKVRFAFLKTLGVFGAGVCSALILSFGLSFFGMGLTVADTGGECTLISHGGKHVAVDCRGEKLGTLMQNRNIRKLDLLLITSVPEQGESCAEELILSGKVRRVALAAYSGKREDAEIILSAAEKKGVPVDVISSDRNYLFGKTALSVFVPASAAEGRGSAAVFCEYGGARTLITGRVSAKAQERMISTRELSSVEVLVLSSGESRPRCSDGVLALAGDGLVLVSGERGKDGLLSEKNTRYTCDIGNITALFFGGKIYIYN